MLSRQTLKLDDIDTTNVVSGEVETLSCHWYDPIIMKLLSEQFSETLSEGLSTSVLEKQ